MKLTDRLRHPLGRIANPAPATTPDHIHIDRNGELVIDIREPSFVIGRPPTTDMPCPQCGGDLEIDAIDSIAKLAEMRCPSCGFHFQHRLQLPVDPEP